MKDIMISKSELMGYLSEGAMTVTFTKKDGSDRVMRCTRNFTMIPTESHPKGDGFEIKDDDNIKVFDLDLNQWRSFNYTTLKA